MRCVVALAALSLVACRKDTSVAKDNQIAKDNHVAEDIRPEKPHSPPTLSLGAAPHPFGALEGMTIGGTTSAEVQRIPGIERMTDESTEMYALDGGDILYAIEIQKGTISHVMIKVRGLLPADLVKAWGAGTVNKSNDVTFLDRAHHLRATASEFAAADRVRIDLQSYMPLASLFDREPAKLFGTTVLGRSEEEVNRALASHYVSRDDISATLDATELSQGNVVLTLFSNSAGIVESYGLDNVLDEPTDETSAETSKLFTSLWGPSREHDGISEYGSTVPVRVDHSFAVHVGRPE